MRKSLIRNIKKRNRLHPQKPLTTAPLKPDVNWYLFLVFVGSMSLAVWSINLYQNTFIDWRLLILPSVLGCMLANLLFYAKLRRAGETLWTALLVCSICGGCIAHFLTLYLNRSFADREERQEAVFPVVGRGRFAKGKGSTCAQPYVTISFRALEKDIVFSCDDDAQVFRADSIRVSWYTGLFGFEVIHAKRLQ